ncbi:MAG: hypothetical protein SF066_04150 [Thermoanaerobaculia bacterium]|nr:hypothetical protein [Thermoanaerobaculia bacterium]
MDSRGCALFLLLAVAFSGTARADLCSPDTVPAATLLLPYFEVDVANPSGKTTVFSVNNAAAQATLAHVTLWTDSAVPTLNFDVYLTGYDVQTFNLRDLLHGVLPQTAIASQDPADTISPQGALSQDTNFPGCPIVNVAPPVLGDSLIRAHQGRESPPYGGCVAFPHTDGLARGYVTVDVVSRCSVLAPSDPGYFSGVAAFDNRLWGSYFYVDPAGNSAQQENLVHIEACDEPSGCTFASGDATFYGRYLSAAQDQREPLPTTFAAAYVQGGTFSGGTRLVVWRDPSEITTTTGACGSQRPTWFPLTELALSFDEAENSAAVCDGPGFDPPSLGCFPLASQELTIGQGVIPGSDRLNLLAGDFGWLLSDFNQQAWMTAVLTADERFSVASDAVALDHGCNP